MLHRRSFTEEDAGLFRSEQVWIGLVRPVLGMAEFVAPRHDRIPAVRAFDALTKCGVLTETTGGPASRSGSIPEPSRCSMSMLPRSAG